MLIRRQSTVDNLQSTVDSLQCVILPVESFIKWKIKNHNACRNQIKLNILPSGMLFSVK